MLGSAKTPGIAALAHHREFTGAGREYAEAHATHYSERNLAAALTINRAKGTSDEHLAVTLHGDRINDALDSRDSILKASVQTAVHIEPRDIVASGTSNSAEFTADDHFTIVLQSN